MIDRLKLTNFRSYSDHEIEFGPDINLVVGPNASGKTNLLESLYVLAVTKSFRAKDRELIKHGQEFFRIEASSETDNYSLGYQVTDGRQEKRVSHGDAKKPLTSHVGTITVVLFEPGDLQMIWGPPEGRRRYLDLILCQTDKEYLKTLNQYRRVLRQRNSLLANFDTGRIKGEIFTWDIKLTELAAILHDRRVELLSYLSPLVNDIYAEIAGHGPEMEFVYLPSVSGDYADAFMAALASNLVTDLATGFTTIGPHREDFRISFKNNDITSIASRGEVRTSVLALRLAELSYSQQRTDKKPILLLDDVFSELDQTRRQDLVRRLEGYQTIITTTEADSILPDIKGSYQIIETKNNARTNR
ncbi:MAG TPA: DNA replication/repair protein RecF [Candidatus Nanoarchaeia archaeon]|nr:DNA replication/repair protein RecF [Candidatus Nanoarchaeia archaeon]